MAVDIRQKTAQGSPLLCIGEAAGRVVRDGQRIPQAVPMAFYDINGLTDHPVQMRISLASGAISAAVRNGHRVRQLIVGQNVSVSVINHPSGPGRCLLPRNLVRKFRPAVRPV